MRTQVAIVGGGCILPGGARDAAALFDMEFKICDVISTDEALAIIGPARAEAEAAFRRALALDPTQPKARFYLASALAHQIRNPHGAISNA